MKRTEQMLTRNAKDHEYHKNQTIYIADYYYENQLEISSGREISYRTVSYIILTNQSVTVQLYNTIPVIQNNRAKIK